MAADVAYPHQSNAIGWIHMDGDHFATGDEGNTVGSSSQVQRTARKARRDRVTNARDSASTIPLGRYRF